MGFWVMPAVVFMLPKRDRMDEVAYNRGQIVSEFRRIIAWALDMLVIMAPVAVFFAIDKEKFMNAGCHSCIYSYYIYNSYSSY